MKYRRLILQLEAPADLVNRMEIEAKVLGISIGELVVQMLKAGYRVGSIRKQVSTVDTLTERTGKDEDHGKFKNEDRHRGAASRRSSFTEWFG